MDLPFFYLHVGHRPTRLSAGDLAIVLLAPISATSGPENNRVCLQILEYFIARRPGKNPAPAFHFDRKGDQGLVRLEA
jgi:hypothetical protein